MKTKKITAILTLIVLLAPAVALAQDTSNEKIDLRLNLTEGAIYSTLITIDQKVSQTVQGQNTDLNQLISMGADSQVLAVEPNGTTTLAVTYEFIKLKMDCPQGTVEYDSENPVIDTNNPQTAMMAQMYAAMLGQKLIMKFTDTGRILAVEGFDEMIENMMDELGAADPNMVQPMKEMMKNFISEDTFQEMGQNMVASFPGFPVGIGDLWYDTISLGADFPIDMDVTYVLKDRKDGVAVIGSVVKMDLGDADSSLIEVEDMKMNLQLAGTQNGSAEVDEATGWNIASSIKQNFTGAMKIDPNPQMPDGLSIPMSIESTVTTTSVQKQ